MNQDTDAEAATLNNLGVLIFEFAGDDLKRCEEASTFVQRAVEIMQASNVKEEKAIWRADAPLV